MIKFLRPNEQRAKLAVTLIWIMLALEIISLISGTLQFILLEKIQFGENVSVSAGEANDLREQVIGIIYLIAYIISAITFIRWFRRAYYNLHKKVDYLSNTEGWAAGAWFVPIISLFRPYQIMKEMYVRTKDLLIENGIEIRENLSTNILGIWWTLWIISNILGQISFRFSQNAETIEAMIIGTLIDLVVNLIGIPLALVTIKVIKNYSQIEHKLQETNNDETITDNTF